MMALLTSSAKKVQAALQEKGFSFRVEELPGSTRTALDAAQAVGCQVGQIAKSLVFKMKGSGEPILVIASGANRVDEGKLAEQAGEPVKMAHPDFVRRHTGFAIGGVPPVGHDHPMKTWIDEDLLAYEEIWAAAGTPHALFRFDPADLPRMTDGTVISVKPDGS
jgi:prolyl-tRNA editing enzyme YbaK/EbsC (Cys-tRNA(Pro) deacylase)